MPNICNFQPKMNFLEKAHTNFVSSIRIAPHQILIRIKNNTTHLFRFSDNEHFDFPVRDFPKIGFRFYFVTFSMLYIFLYYFVEGHIA